MLKIKFTDIFSEELASDAILNEEYTGFKEDYLTLHCLLKIHKPASFLEIGTNMGTGTKIIKNALGPDSTVYSLDLPKGDKVGERCDLPFTQLRGDSLLYPYNELGPIEGWFIDGEHDYLHANHEAKAAIANGAKLIIFHDADIHEVYNGITDAFEGNESYDLFRVSDTRIAYALYQ